MSEVQIVIAELEAASRAAIEAAEFAGAQLAKQDGASDSSKTLMAAGEALQGSRFALSVLALGTGWDEQIRGWAKDADSFGTAFAKLSADYQSTDGLVSHTIVELDRVGRN